MSRGALLGFLLLAMLLAVVACKKEPDFPGLVEKHRAAVDAKLAEVDAVAKKAGMPQDAQIYGFKAPDPPAVWSGEDQNAIVLLKSDLADVTAVTPTVARPTVPEGFVRAAKAVKKGDFGPERSESSFKSLGQELSTLPNLRYVLVVQAGGPSQTSFVGVAQIWDLASAEALGAFPLQAHAPDGAALQKKIDEALVTELAKAIERAG